MQQHELNGRVILLVEVPEQSFAFTEAFGYLKFFVTDESRMFTTQQILNEALSDRWKTRGKYNTTHGDWPTRPTTPIKLPEGNWRFIAQTKPFTLSDTITEEQAAEMVETIGPNELGWDDTVFVNYTDGNSFEYSSEPSFTSWLQSIGITHNCAILVKQ